MNFQSFLYKYKLNEKTLLDILPKLSDETIKYLMNDLKDIQTEIIDKDIIYIFTDGGYRKKTNKAAYSIFFMEDEYRHLDKTELLEDTTPTNNKAELMGILESCKILKNQSKLFKNCKIVICTDSMYSIKCINTWSKTWVKNNWKNSKGEQVKNKEMIQDIINVIKTIENEITFKHVFSHLQKPSDIESIEYLYWYGNKKVDDAITDLIEN